MQFFVIFALDFIFADDLPGKKEMWIVGDNFMSTTYRQYFKLAEHTFYTKKHFEIVKHCNSRFALNYQNMISRIVNTVISLTNSKKYLPAYLVLVLDDDMIEYLNYFNSGVSVLYSKWLEYLAKEINLVLLTRWNQLPVKCKENTLPQVYWVSCPVHNSFDHAHLREKWNITLQTVMKTIDNMCMVRIKDFWSPTNMSLVVNNRLTTEGLYTYWKVIDAALKFNALKRREF